MPELRELTPLDIKPEYTRESFAELTEPLKSGEKAKVEFRTVHRRKDGSTYPVEVHLQSTLYEGEPGFVAIILDLTRAEKAEAERRALDEKVRHSQKLESLGVLAGGIAHDFNNLLVGILGNADLALHEMSETTPGRPYIADIVAASQRAAALCKQMLAYSGKGRFVIKAVNLSDVVEDMGHLLQVAIPKKVVLKYDLEPNLPAVEVDVAQLQQVIMNLITNAAEAIGDRSGIVTIATGAMECDRDYLRETYLDEELPEGSYVYVEVSDTGEGMNQETKAKLFDPFFTTKFAGRGLGLAAVLGVVRGHRGAIKVYSELGRGTTIKFLLPASNEPAEGIAPDAPPSDDWQGSGTVLVIDDEETIRVLARRILESAGFAVLTAADGLEGVATYAEHADDLTAVLLDMTMPKMGGEEAFREMHRIRSDVPVILSSGYNEQEAISRFAGKGLAGFIQKPYRVSQLIAEFRRVLAPEARPDDQAQ